MHVQDVATQSSAIFETRYTEWLKDMFPQVVKKHLS